jgi:hypothetical protein
LLRNREIFSFSAFFAVKPQTGFFADANRIAARTPAQTDRFPGDKMVVTVIAVKQSPVAQLPRIALLPENFPQP